MLKIFLDSISHFRPCIKPILRYISYNIEEFSGVNELKRETPIIVSLSSNEEHFDNLELTLYSLLNQKVCPDRIILWLSDEYELLDLPYSITRFIKNGLEIRFVEEKGSYTAIINALKEFEKAINVLASDNVYYPRDWLKKLYHSYISNPADIHAHTSLKVLSSNGQVSSYKNWARVNRIESAEYTNYPLFYGGILYPPNCYKKEVFREDIYKTKVKTDWELWSWCMAVVSNRKVRVVKNHIESFRVSNYLNIITNEYKKLKKYQYFDMQLSKLMDYYKQNIDLQLGK